MRRVVVNERHTNFGLTAPFRQIAASAPTIWTYTVGSRIRVRLYSGKVVEAEITAITNQSAGRQVRIVYGSVTTVD
jgi:hypothetical protein